MKDMESRAFDMLFEEHEIVDGFTFNIANWILSYKPILNVIKFMIWVELKVLDWRV